MASRGARAGRPWGELRGSCAEFNDLAVMVRSWLDGTGRTAAGMMAALVAEDFTDGVVPARHRVYDMLSGYRIQLDFVEAVARHCFDGEQMVKRLRPARVLWDKAQDAPTPVGAVAGDVDGALAVSERRVAALEQITSLQEALRTAEANANNARHVALVLLGLTSRQRERIRDLERELEGFRAGSSAPGAQVRTLQEQLERARAQLYGLDEERQRAESQRDYHKDIAAAAIERLREVEERLNSLTRPSDPAGIAAQVVEPLVPLEVLVDPVSVELDAVDEAVSRAREMLDHSRDSSDSAAREAGLDLPAEHDGHGAGVGPTIVVGEVVRAGGLSGTTSDNLPSWEAGPGLRPGRQPGSESRPGSGEQVPLVSAAEVERIRAEIERDFAPAERRGRLAWRRSSADRLLMKLQDMEPAQAAFAIEALEWGEVRLVLERIHYLKADAIVATWVGYVDAHRLRAGLEDSAASGLLPMLRRMGPVRLGAILQRVPPERAALIMERIGLGDAVAVLEAMDPVRANAVIDHVSRPEWIEEIRLSLTPTTILAIQAAKLDLVPADSAAYELEAVEPWQAVSVLERMRPERAAGALERMVPVKAAKALARMNIDQGAMVMIHMDPEWAAQALDQMNPAPTVGALTQYIVANAAEVKPRIKAVLPILAALMSRLHPEEAAGALAAIDKEWAGEVLLLMPSEHAAMTASFMAGDRVGDVKKFGLS